MNTYIWDISGIQTQIILVKAKVPNHLTDSPNVLII